MITIGRAALAAIISLTLAGCSSGAAPAATPITTNASKPAAPAAPAAQAAPTNPPASAALIVGALEPKPFSGLAGPISAIRFSPDGKILAAGGNDPFVQLWDASSGQALKTLKAKDARDFNLGTIVFSPDGKRVAKDGPPLVVWDVSTGQPLFEKNVLNSSNSGGGSATIAFSPDGKTLAAGDAFSLQLLDASTGDQLKSLVDNAKVDEATIATRSLAFSPDGSTLASAGPANAVTLWAVTTGQKAASLTGTATQIGSVAFSPDGKFLAGAGDKDITVWELPAGTSPRTLVHQSTEHGAVSSVAFSGDGKYLAGTSIRGLDLWDVATWKAVPITTALNQGVRDAVALSPDGLLLAGVASMDDHVVHVWSLQPGPVTTAGSAPAPAAPAANAQARPDLTPPAAGAKPTGARAAGFDACTLVSQAEAEAALGAPVVTTDNQPTACRYRAADGSSVGIDSAGGTSAQYSNLMFKTSHDIGSTVTDIAGLGDKAFSSGEDPSCCALYVLKGSTLVEIVVMPFDRSFEHGAPTAKLLTLARAAVSHL